MFLKSSYIKHQSGKTFSTCFFRKKTNFFLPHYKCPYALRIKQKQKQTTWIMDLRIKAVPEMASPYRSVMSVLLNQRGRTGIPALTKDSFSRCNLRHPGKWETQKKTHMLSFLRIIKRVRMMFKILLNLTWHCERWSNRENRSWPALKKI